MIVPFLPVHKPQMRHVREEVHPVGQGVSAGSSIAGNPSPSEAELTRPGTVDPHSHGGGALHKFEHQLKLPVDVGLFFFAFANAGVEFGSINQVTLIVLLSLIVGKTVGISAFSWIGERFGFPLPSGMQVRHLVVASIIAGLGLTVALFVANKAYDGPPFQDPAKMGALLSVGAAVSAFVVARLLKIKRTDEYA